MAVSHPTAAAVMATGEGRASGRKTSSASGGGGGGGGGRPGGGSGGKGGQGEEEADVSLSPEVLKELAKDHVFVMKDASAQLLKESRVCLYWYNHCIHTVTRYVQYVM